MIKLLLILVIVYFFIKAVGKRYFPSHINRRQDQMNRQPGGGESGINDLVKDPHCGTYISYNDAVKAHIKGKDLYFCSKTCMERYLAEKS